MPQEILDLLARLADEAQRGEISNDDLTAARDELRTQFDDLANGQRTTESVALMSQIADAMTTLDGEETRRAEEQAALEEQAAALIARVSGETDDDETPEDETPAEDGEEETPAEGDETQTPEGETPAEEQTPEAVAASTTPAGGARTEARRVASLSSIAAGQPATARRPARQDEARAVLVAAADVPGISAGARIRDAAHLSQLMARKIDSTRNARPGETFMVASIEHRYPTSRTLTDDNPDVNRARIDAVASPEAVVAAGGFCGPAVPRYDLLGLSVADRPVRDSLAQFGADRGAVTWNDPPVLGDLDGAVSVWTREMDEDPAAPDKPCIDIECGENRTAEIEGIPLCLTFSNMTARTSPEVVQANNRVALATHARFAEARLLTRMDTSLTAVTDGDTLGASRAILTSLITARAGIIGRHRMDLATRFRLILPFWTRDLIRIDIARQLATDIGGPVNPFNITDAQVDAWLTNAGCNVRWHMGDLPGERIGAQAAGPLTGFPATVQARMYPEGSFLFLDGGRLDLGVQRSPETNRRNRYTTFVETFEQAAFVGVPDSAYRLTLTTSATGASAGTVVPAA